jgi:hypothetical protein
VSSPEPRRILAAVAALLDDPDRCGADLIQDITVLLAATGFYPLRLRRLALIARMGAATPTGQGGMA